MLIDKAYMVYDENEAKKIETLDSIFLGFCEGYKVNNWLISSMISNDLIEKCEYFESMPQHLTFASGAGENNISYMLNKNSAGIENMPVSGYGFTPAACLHFYPMLEKHFKYNELITTRQKVYRYENLLRNQSKLV